MKSTNAREDNARKKAIAIFDGFLIPELFGDLRMTACSNMEAELLFWFSRI